MSNILRTALACGAFLCVPQSVFAECVQDRISLRGDWGQAVFNVEIADDPQERALGLMHRETMAMSSGMLFVYDGPHRASFWMENTLISLDMLFIDVTGVVSRIAQDAVPLDRTPIDGGENVQYVLEINAGLVDAYGISEGAQVQHPSITGDVVWPCFAE
ncbi:DUF192 domain-containing protein [Cochlodiniinecator piscidefendens]|uniref:DUF192 domain-containing protein n=1 Tax=Cochlodiniinecator piscidefendens TaxID=2715756 RepID=UPI00140BD7A9|nr:DUF192 domain-containing protein [Cochlodiniinecator piscidefendens]